MDGHYDDGRRSYYAKAIVAGIVPELGSVWRAMDSVKSMDDYLKNRGMSYSDIKYPALTPAFNSVAGATTMIRNEAVQFVSRNISKLYDDGD